MERYQALVAGLLAIVLQLIFAYIGVLMIASFARDVWLTVSEWF